ncbi:MAG TPA: hypothetical protein VK427_00080, partial [Kofleriaceae bacterium]|nr:hypothetical protein [Kofleriaceae bacterium]
MLAVIALLVSPALAADDERLSATIIYARGNALYKSDARGRNESQLVQLPSKATVRAMRTDIAGKTLLVDVGGKWSWMPLDRPRDRPPDRPGVALAGLPCADGPAQLATDGTSVVCRSIESPDKSVLVQLDTGTVTKLDAPPTGARLVGSGRARKLVWADANGVWGAPPNNLQAKTKLAAEAPRRGFLP